MGKAILDIGGASIVAVKFDAPVSLPADALAFDAAAPCCMGTVLGGCEAHSYMGGRRRRLVVNRWWAARHDQRDPCVFAALAEYRKDPEQTSQYLEVPRGRMLPAQAWMAHRVARAWMAQW